jgi:hypothetical protein
MHDAAPPAPGGLYFVEDLVGRRVRGGAVTYRVRWRGYAGAAPRSACALSEKDAKLAQKLGQLQPYLSVFPQECMGQLVFFGPT